MIEFSTLILITGSVSVSKDVLSSLEYLDQYLYIVENKLTAQLSLVLSRMPSSVVTISLSSNNSLVDFSFDEVIFTTSNWATPQIINLSGLDNLSNDQGITNDVIKITYSSSDSDYNGSKTINCKVAASELDDIGVMGINSLKFNPEDDYNYSEESELNDLRSSVINTIWSGNGIPSNDTPDALVTDFTPDSYFNPTASNLDSINRLRWNLSNGHVNYIYHCVPTTSVNKCLFIFGGHGDNWSNLGTSQNNQLVIEEFINEGFDVFFGYMTARGPNTPLVASHDFSGLEDTGVFHPLELFLNSWVYTLNYVNNNFSFSNLYCTGLSGGGWTTVLMGAIFEDFEKMFEASGSFPRWLRDTTDDGDYEQGTYQGFVGSDMYNFYNDHSYSDLYSLAAWKRTYLQFQNTDDSCCFEALPKKYQIYVPLLMDRVDAFSQGGKFEHYVYTNAGNHGYNSEVISVMKTELGL